MAELLLDGFFYADDITLLKGTINIFIIIVYESFQACFDFVVVDTAKIRQSFRFSKFNF